MSYIKGKKLINKYPDHFFMSKLSYLRDKTSLKRLKKKYDLKFEFLIDEVEFKYILF